MSEHTAESDAALMTATLGGLTHECADPECHVWGFINTSQRMARADAALTEEDLADLRCRHFPRDAHDLFGCPVPLIQAILTRHLTRVIPPEASDRP